MSIIVKGSEPKTVNIEDGLHIGVIKEIVERQPEGKDYKYLDVHIKIDGQDDVEVKVGFSFPKPEVGLNSKQDLGKLVQRMTGSEIKINENYDLESVLVGKKVQFQTIENEKGYAEIIKHSVKPAVFETSVSSEGKKVRIVE